MQKPLKNLTVTAVFGYEAHAATAVVEYYYCPMAGRMLPRTQASQPSRPTSFWICAN